MKLATRSVLAVAEMCMKQSRIPSFEIRLLGAFEKSALFTFSHPVRTLHEWEEFVQDSWQEVEAVRLKRSAQL